MDGNGGCWDDYYIIVIVDTLQKMYPDTDIICKTYVLECVVIINICFTSSLCDNHRNRSHIHM